MFRWAREVIPKSIAVDPMGSNNVNASGITDSLTVPFNIESRKSPHSVHTHSNQNLSAGIDDIIARYAVRHGAAGGTG
jgi:hypothetical protein